MYDAAMSIITSKPFHQSSGFSVMGRGSWQVAGVCHKNVPSANCLGSLLDSILVRDVCDVDGDFGLGVLFLDDALGLFEGPLCSAKDVQSGRAGLRVGIDNLAADSLAGTCDDDDFSGLG